MSGKTVRDSIQGSRFFPVNQSELRGTYLAGIFLTTLNTRVFGQDKIFYYPVIDSTNTCAKDLAASGDPEGTVVVADCQLSGRGQYGRPWYSPSGKGMYFSVILRPKSLPEHSRGITLLTAVSLAQTLRDLCGVPVQIKWPNDILIHGKKLAGILTEMSAVRDAVEYVVVGVGINVGHQRGDFPTEISDRATSLFMECGRAIPREIILGSFLERFEQDYDLFSSSGLAPIVAMWKDLADIVGREVRVSINAGSFVGTVLDLDPGGFLIVEDATGIPRRVLSGDISLTF
ncbi:MAG: biotin--[acetyl-CoA-carboxylase] ligase [Desulfomonilia bacterium]